MSARPRRPDKLTGLVNKGELYVANGDVQMNISQMAQNPNIRIFFPAGPNGSAPPSRCPTISAWCTARRTAPTARS